MFQLAPQYPKDLCWELSRGWSIFQIQNVVRPVEEELWVEFYITRVLRTICRYLFSNQPASSTLKSGYSYPASSHFLSLINTDLLGTNIQFWVFPGFTESASNPRIGCLITILSRLWKILYQFSPTRLILLSQTKNYTGVLNTGFSRSLNLLLI